jgi:hypothetical protein
MSDSTILYAGIICFSLIIVGFVLTAREFSRNADNSASGKRKPQVAYRT